MRNKACGPVSLVFILAATALLAGCRRQATHLAEEGTKQRRPNIIIYLIDTLRPDHLGVYGYERNTTPRIDEFAEDAEVFENAFSPSGWTKPAVASLLTGLNPAKHGAITRDNALSGDVVMLSEYLAPLGYHTAAVVTNPNIIPYWGFDQGFDAFLDVRAETRNRHTDADTVNEWTIRHLAETPPGPFFLYIHTMDPHSPYTPPPPFDQMFTDDDLGLHSPAGLSPETPEDVFRSTVAQYDGEVAFNDAQFGLLMDYLKQQGLYQDALIILVADHGEEFLDHEAAGHGHTLYQELVHVPLIVKWPGNARAGTRTAARVALIDWVPTLLGYLGQDVPRELEGMPLTFLFEERDREVGDRALYFDLDLVRANSRLLNVSKGVLAGPYKYIEVDNPVEKRMLFDLSKDPREQADILSSTRPEMVARLRDMLWTYRASAAAGLHLRVVNAGDLEERVISGTLKTEGRFAALQRVQLEQEDQVGLDAQGQTLSFRFQLANYPNPTLGGKPSWLVDFDHLTFQVDPARARVTVERLEADSEEPVPLYVGREKRLVEPLPAHFRQDEASLQVPEIGVLFRRGGQGFPETPLGVYLAAVAPVERIEMDEQEMPSELREQLMKLGYIGEDEGDALSEDVDDNR